MDLVVVAAVDLPEELVRAIVHRDVEDRLLLLGDHVIAQQLPAVDHIELGRHGRAEVPALA
jgi:hypothetical protein